MKKCYICFPRYYLRFLFTTGLNVSPNSSLKQRYGKPGGAKKAHGVTSGTPPTSLGTTFDIG